MSKLEIEVKFYLPDAAAMRQAILELGAQSGGRHFEHNIRYEDRCGSLMKKKSLLRLRRGRRNTLTCKYPGAQKTDQFKVFNELEVVVDSFDTMHCILEFLGLRAVQVYEKWRESLDLAGTRFCIDRMPFADFLEIEGAADKIRSYASRLGLDWKHRIVLNYLEIFEILKKKWELGFSDPTFENFKNLPGDFKELLNTIRAG